MRDLLYVAPGPGSEADGRDRPARCPSSGNPVFASLAQALETRATAVGFATIICNTAGSAMREVDYVHMLLERRVDGMVFVCSEVTDVRGEHSHYRQLLEQGARLVFVNGGSDAARRSRPSASTSGRRAGSRPSTCSRSGTGASASSPAAQFAQATREKALGRAATRSREAGLDRRALGRARELHGRGRAAGAARAPRVRERRPADRGDLLERPDGDRGASRRPRRSACASRRTSRSSASTGSTPRRGRSPPLTTVEQPIDEIAETTVDALRVADRRRRSRPCRATSSARACAWAGRRAAPSEAPATPRVARRTSAPGQPRQGREHVVQVVERLVARRPARRASARGRRGRRPAPRRATRTGR